MTASEHTLKLSGHHLRLIVSILMTTMQCCSTYLVAVISHQNNQEVIYAAVVFLDYFLVMINLSSVQMVNHLMVRIYAYLDQIYLVMELQLMMMVLICSQTAKKINSQLVS